MFETILSEFSDFTPFWIYLTIFFFAYIENLFPPSPSDMVVVIGGSLVATGSLHFIPTFLFATAGSLLGFLTAFLIGWQFDKRLIHSGKLKFINVQSFEKVETSFRKYGYYLIVANRFLPGTRAVISFFAGMSRLNVDKTTLLSLISSSIWNVILIYLGIAFGENIDLIDSYLKTYSNIILIITAVIILFFIVRYFIKKRKTQI
ncbi:MAG: DedA family protein [Ignavibacteriaceae bacterium]|nr:DedA family protein [Ignavibacteriaceae bacterium]HMN24428.1 DedA family protein [Ignavibacteriaceae bacterium]HRN26868.1 DedA family protein [Ignavibacteriaceae bacterium]HRP92648.1 DedA family protein [Ignavibacteriaceae bacterium]HRQ54486.1 DedA family protein [Ignavibacteriaceae bacterium]